MGLVLNLKTKNIKLNAIRHLLYYISVSGNRFIVTLRLDCSRDISVHFCKFVRFKYLFAIKDSSIEKVCKMFIITPECLKGDIFLVCISVVIVHKSPFVGILFFKNDASVINIITILIKYVNDILNNIL